MIYNPSSSGGWFALQHQCYTLLNIILCSESLIPLCVLFIHFLLLTITKCEHPILIMPIRFIHTPILVGSKVPYISSCQWYKVTLYNYTSTMQQSISHSEQFANHCYKQLTKIMEWNVQFSKIYAISARQWITTLVKSKKQL